MVLLSAPSPAPEGAGARHVDAAALRLHFPEDPQRARVEAFIRRVYAGRYGAQLPAFAPVLASLAGPGGAIVAAAGYRSAASSALFLEGYLREPVEDELAWQSRRPPGRREIVEIVHMAAVRAGAGRQLIRLLGTHLAQQGFRWAVATFTRDLRAQVARMGIVPLALGPADPSALHDGAACWGDYHAHQPVVLAAEIQPALRRLTPCGADDPELVG